MEAGGLAALAAIGTLGYLVIRAVQARNHNLPAGQAGTRGPFPDKLDRLLVLDSACWPIWAAANLYEAASRGGTSLAGGKPWHIGKFVPQAVRLPKAPAGHRR